MSADCAAELRKSPAGVQLAFRLDGVGGGISAASVGISLPRLERLSALGIVDLCDWRPPSSGRVPRRWRAVEATSLTRRLVEEVAVAFRNRNLAAPARGTDMLYQAARDRLRDEARTRQDDWAAAIDEAIQRINAAR